MILSGFVQLVVMAVALGQDNSALALGNLMGSSIANILGSFSLGLLFLGKTGFDRSSKIYALVLLPVVSAFLLFLGTLGPGTAWFAGGALLVAFAVYTASIATLIYRGTLTAPEDDSDSDSSDSSDGGSSDDDSDDDSDDSLEMPGRKDGGGGHRHGLYGLKTLHGGSRLHEDGSNDDDDDDDSNNNKKTANDSPKQHAGNVFGAGRMVKAPAEEDMDMVQSARSPTSRRTAGRSSEAAEESRALVKRRSRRRGKEPRPTATGAVVGKMKRPRPLWHHVAWLLLGFAALLLSSYIVAHSASRIGAALGLSGTTIGTTILSLATTLPEKFIAVASGVKRQPGIVIANTVGSNIFLATLCGGVLFLGGNVEQLRTAFTTFEAVMMWVSAALILAVVMLGARRWMGAVLLSVYVAFIVVELATGRRIDDD
jgi:Ca2+/Na+ antiporter